MFYKPVLIIEYICAYGYSYLFVIIFLGPNGDGDEDGMLLY